MKRLNWKNHVIIVVLIISTVLLWGCSYSIGTSRNSSKKSMKASFSVLNGTEKKAIEIGQGDTVTVKYNIKTDKGELNIKLVDPDNEEVLVFEPNSKGSKVLKADKGGTYNIVIEADKAKGSYSLDWSIEK